MSATPTTPSWNADKSRLTLQVGRYYVVDLAPTDADCRADPRWREGLTYSGARTRAQIDWTMDTEHPRLAHFREYGPYYGLVVETHYVNSEPREYIVGRPLHPHEGLTLSTTRECLYRDTSDTEITIALPTTLTLVIQGQPGRLDDRHVHHDHAAYNDRLAAIEAALSGVSLHLAPDPEDAPTALRPLTTFRKG